MKPLNPGDEVAGWTVERIVELGVRVNLYVVIREGDRAVLRLLRQPDGTMVQRLRRNASVAYLLSERHVVPVRGIIEHGEHPGVLSTYYPKAHSILSWSRRRPRDIDTLVEAFRGMFLGLKTLHDAGLIHRNLKPGKILMVRKIAKIEDVLMATPSDPTFSKVTSPGEAIGASHYVPPEQHLAASKLDASADLYAAGVVCYEMLTGRRPFDGPRLVDILKAKKHQDYEPASRFRADVPPELDALIELLLAPYPADRLSSAVEVLDRLSRVSALPTGPPTPSSPGPARTAHPATSLVGAGMVLMATAALVGGLLATWMSP